MLTLTIPARSLSAATDSSEDISMEDSPAPRSPCAVSPVARTAIPTPPSGSATVHVRRHTLLRCLPPVYLHTYPFSLWSQAVLGVGGHGRVLKATVAGIPEDVALKQLPQSDEHTKQEVDVVRHSNRIHCPLCRALTGGQWGARAARCR